MEVPVNEFKAKLSQILNKLIDDGETVYITRRGKIIAKVIPFTEEQAWKEAKQRLAGSVLKYERPTEPVAENDWEVLHDPS